MIIFVQGARGTMIEFNFYGIFSYLFYSLITSTYFSLVDEFFTELLKVLQPESQFIIYFMVALSVFLTNPYFQSLFKKRI